MYDSVVIGGGPAGLSAALWLGRYRKRTLLIDAGEPRNRWSDAGHGYFPDDTFDPIDVIERARRSLETYPLVIRRCGRVTGVARDGEGFTVDVDGITEHTSSIVIATGTTDVFPDIADIETHYGASVFTCPACDGWEARGTDTCVIGWDEGIPAFALTLLHWARSVTIVTDAHRLQANARQVDKLRARGITVLSDDATAFVGERGDLRGIELRERGFLACTTAFFSIGQRPVNQLARQLGCDVTDEGCVATDDHGSTSVECVYAAGDLTPGPQLVQTAAAEGAVAGISCAKALGLRH